MADQYVDLPLDGGTGVTSLNGETGAITIVAGSGITVTPVGQNITIAATGGGGSVTSVGLSAPAIFNVTGSPVTTSGTLALALATQSANLVWAGPTTGGAATPTFRALVAADLPAGTGTVTGTGTTNTITYWTSSSAIGATSVGWDAANSLFTFSAGAAGTNGIKVGNVVITNVTNGNNLRIALGSSGGSYQLLRGTAGNPGIQSAYNATTSLTEFFSTDAAHELVIDTHTNGVQKIGVTDQLDLQLNTVTKASINSTGVNVVNLTASKPVFSDASKNLVSTGTVPVDQGGTSLTTLTANNVILGNGTSAPIFVAPSTSGNLLTSNGTTWQSTAAAFASNTLASAHLLVGSAGNIATDTAITGDVTISNTGVTAIGTNKVTNTQLAQIATQTIKGRITASTGNVEDLTQAQARVVIDANADRSSFTFRPGVTASGNAYSSWATLYAALILTTGARFVYFDDSNGAQTVTIPSGTYDLAGVTFVGAADNPTINLANGCVFSGFPTLDGAMDLASQSNSAVYTVPASGLNFFYINNLANISSNGSASMFSVPFGSSLVMLVENIASIATGSFESFDVAGGIIFYLTDGGSLSSSTVRGAGDLSIFYAAASGVFDTSQPNFSGSLVLALLELAALVSYNGAGSSLAADNVQSILDQLSSGVLSKQSIVPTNAGSGTISDNVGQVVLKPAGVIAAYTLTMPANPIDKQIVRICSNGVAAITTLTLSPNTGQTFGTGAAITTLAANGFAGYTWDLGDTKWYRIG